MKKTWSAQYLWDRIIKLDRIFIKHWYDVPLKLYLEIQNFSGIIDIDILYISKKNKIFVTSFENDFSVIRLSWTTDMTTEISPLIYKHNIIVIHKSYSNI